MFGLIGGAFSPSAHAENVRYDVNINSSLTLGFSSNTVSLNLNPGSQVFDSQDITTTVSTNNQYGYDLYVTSSGTDLINQTDNTYTIPTLPAKEGGYDVDTFLADKWGVMMNNTSYEPFVSGTTVSQSSTVTNADNTILTFGAKTSYNTAPGNYKLALNFQLVARVATNDLTINFAGEGVESVKVCTVAGDCTGDNLVGIVTTSGNSVPGLKDGSSYYLYPVFTSGYEFVSWEKTSEAGTISDTTILNPTFTMTDEPASVTVTGKTKLYMQDMVANQCTTTAQTVYDKRDDQAYLVQQLADGKCWFLDNLRLGASTLVETLSTSNTNMSSSVAFTLPASSSSGFNKYDTAMINTADANTTTTSYGSGSGKIGVYYNYCAASAGTYCMAEGSGSGNASYDVCPAGWRMPTGGSSGEYQNLYSKYSSNATNFRNALSTPLSGYFYDSSPYYQGSGGYFWSSTRYGGSDMYRLNVSSSDVSPQSSRNRYRGFSVRCVLETRTIADVAYMQDVTPAMLANTAEGATATLIDKRDNQSYLVGKLADGKLWMLDNLRLGSADLVEALSTSNTNMSSSVAFTLPASSSSGFNKYDTAMINTAYANTTTTSYGSGSGKIGVYYNYCAASAGTYCMAEGSGSGNASYDVCPKGWRMPTGGSSGEYQALCDKIKGSSCGTSWSDNQAFRAALSTPLSGYFNNSSAGNQGSYGNFWSSTYYDGNYMYDFSVSSSSVDPQHSRYRGYGFSVRCVLK